MELRTVDVSTLAALVLAGVGIIAPIAWDQYKSRSALELDQLSNVSLIEKSADLDKLQVFYASRPIDRVTRLSFALRNSGRTPIRASDVITAPTVHFGTAEILDVRVDRRDPADLEFSATPDPQNHSAIIAFPLLNPGDVGRFSVLVGGPSPKFSANARIVGVRELTIGVNQEGSRHAALPWTFYVVAVVTVLLLMTTISFVVDVGKELALRYLGRLGALSLPSSGKKSDYLQFVDRVLKPFKTAAEVDPVSKVLVSVPNDKDISPEEHQAFSEGMLQALNDVSAVKEVAGMFGTLTLIGVAYLAAKLLAL